MLHKDARTSEQMDTDCCCAYMNQVTTQLRLVLFVSCSYFHTTDKYLYFFIIRGAINSKRCIFVLVLFCILGDMADKPVGGGLKIHS